MRAVVTENYGSPPCLIEVPTPQAAPGEVRVRMRRSSLNGFDNALAAGYLKGMMEHRFPVVLGRDFAGTVDQVGAGVSLFGPGDDVFGVILTQPLHAGAFGEFLVVPENHYIGRIPDGLDHATAGVLGLAGAAAMAVLDAVGARAGETMLVCGATGGVGSVALQLAAARGITTIATVASDADTEHVRDLGATHVVAVGADLAAQVRDLAPGGVDTVLHLAGDPVTLATLLAGNGRFASLLGTAAMVPTERAITATDVIASPVRALLEHLADQVARGHLRIPVQRSYPLAEVPKAFVDFAGGTRGKLAVDID